MITIDELKELEFLAQEQGITPLQLMENAGKQIFRTVKKKVDLTNKHIIVFAGQGNNGGDGFVAARHFAKEFPVIVLFFGSKEKMSEEARQNYLKANKQVTIIHIEKEEDLQKFRFQKNAELILIDALLGTGIKGKLSEQMSLAVNHFNSLQGHKIAVDIPSGMNINTGVTEEKTCHADLIITYHDHKPGLETMKEKTVVVDIGLPRKKAENY